MQSASRFPHFRSARPAAQLAVVALFLSGCGVGIYEVTPGQGPTSLTGSNLLIVDSSDQSVDGKSATEVPPKLNSIYSLLQNPDGTSSRPPVQWSVSNPKAALLGSDFAKSAIVHPLRTGPIAIQIVDPSTLKMGTAQVSIKSRVAFLGAIRPLIGSWDPSVNVALSNAGADGFLAYPKAMVSDNSGYVYVTDTTHSRVSRYSATTGAWLGSVGATFTSSGTCESNGPVSGWCTGGNFTPSFVSGGFNNPAGITVSGDAAQSYLFVTDSNPASPFESRVSVLNRATGAFVTSYNAGQILSGALGLASDSSGAIYIADSSNHRVVKLASDGSLIGWIGKVSTSPTGGAAGCNSAVAGTITPGWCTGGSAGANGIIGAFSSPQGVAVDSNGVLYVADTGNSRISRYNATTGVYRDSIGYLSTAGGCAIGALPAWSNCGAGAVFGSVNQDGAFSSPVGIAIDSRNDLFYVAHSNGARVSQHRLSTGAFIGSVGNSTASTGTCPATGPAQSWCTGGTFSSSPVLGGFSGSIGVTLASDGNLIVLENLNQRLSRIRATGQPLGSVGGSTQTTAPSGWGLLQLSSSGADDNGFNQPGAVTSDGTYLYIADSQNGRIKKVRPGSGETIGSIGFVSATGGTCTVTGPTSGWCLGGTFNSATNTGAMVAPAALTWYGGKLYVADTGNNRISRYNATTGAFEGSLGVLSGGTFQNWTTSIYTFVGSTTAGAVTNPRGIAVSPDGSSLYVSDTGQNRVNKYDLVTGNFIISTNDSPGSPKGLIVDPTNVRVLVLTSTQVYVYTTSLGTKTQAFGSLSAPVGIAYDSSANLYITETGRVIRHGTWNGSGHSANGWFGLSQGGPVGGGDPGCPGNSVYGSPLWWFCQVAGTALAADATSSMGLGGLSGLVGGLTVDSTGTVYVADTGNHRVLRIAPDAL